MFVDSSFSFKFIPVQKNHHKRVLIDTFHPTIFKGRTNPYEDKVMLDVLAWDKFSVSFLDQQTTYSTLKQKGDILVIAGIANEAQLLSETD